MRSFLAILALFGALLSSGCMSKGYQHETYAPTETIVRPGQRAAHGHDESAACGWGYSEHFWYDQPEQEQDLPYHPDPLEFVPR